MKRSTTLARKTPLRATSTLKAKKPLARKASPAKGVAKTKALRTKQRAVTAAEKALWNRLATEIGCIACLKDGRFNPHVSIHHVDGRTKPGCHSLVLPLCAPHHQHVDDDPLGRIGVHPWKARFEERYGDQREMVRQCLTLLEAGA